MIKYRNRKDDIYYLHEKKDKNGKTRYHFSTKEDGCSDLKKVPSGYEIYEKHYGQVFFRKKQPQVITDDELKCVKNEISKHHHLKYTYVEVIKNSIVIYNAETECLENTRESLSFLPYSKNINMEKFANYTEVMKFELIDKESRFFKPYRFCYRGNIDDWVEIDLPDLLNKHAEKYINKIGTEEFFEIMPTWF